MSDVAAENELICEKLLGWKPCSRHVVHGWMEWAVEPGPKFYRTPTFDSWRESGLILEALKQRAYLTSIQFTKAGGYCATDNVSATDASVPLAIRAAALAYIRSLP